MSASHPSSLKLKVKISAKADGGAKIPPIQHLPRLLMNMTKAAPAAKKPKIRFGK